MQGIYRIRNIVNDKRYVGSTNDFLRHWNDYKCSLQKGKFHNAYLQRAWNKYGGENFVFEIEEKVEGDTEVLLICEQVYLDEGFEQGILYNIAKKAECPPNHKDKKFSKEHCTNISKALMGHEFTDESRAKMSKAHIGQKHSKETRAKMSRAHKGREITWADKIAKSYPAFYNIKTDEIIPPGRNFAEMCRGRGFNHDKFYAIKSAANRQTKDGWRLATENEIAGFGGYDKLNGGNNQ